MKASQKVLAAAMLAMLGNTAVLAQNLEAEILWTGLFGPYSRHPLPNDPLPDVSLSPYGEIPRPLVQTSRVPAKLGTRFGILFALHGSKKFTVTVHQVVHYPTPGLMPGSDQKPREKSELDALCFVDLPCYVGYSFRTKDEILPGEWRMEVQVDGINVVETNFLVDKDSSVASSTSFNGDAARAASR
jgi:hypothetical protein